MPDSGTIIASRGRVDYYLWKGVPVARSWPVYTPYTPSAAELATRNAFINTTKATGYVGSAINDMYRAMHAGLGITWVDHFRATARGKPWVYIGR